MSTAKVTFDQLPEAGEVKAGDYKDAKEERVRDYVTSLLTNEKVFEFLENQGATE